MKCREEKGGWVFLGTDWVTRRVREGLQGGTVHPQQTSGACLKLQDYLVSPFPGLYVEAPGTKPSTGIPWLSVWWLGGEGNGTPLQYSCLENPMDGGACLVGCSPWVR